MPILDMLKSAFSIVHSIQVKMLHVRIVYVKFNSKEHLIFKINLFVNTY